MDSFYVLEPPITGGEEVDGYASMSEATTNTQSYRAHTSNRFSKKRARSVDLLVASVVE
ncbi:hypothetical protein Csa_009969 [Cucumis sativus]|uniref:Uncharacterized protein n=1 Tax=Cucumis sativus TaxID=3659 RepID=A0A0A0L2J4_CUCSA|nr:hypothetical protein Csa_009969 [Cucumis sativus]